MKAEVATIESSKLVLDLVDEASERGEVRFRRACRAFGGRQVCAQLSALDERCKDEMKQYEAARATCEAIRKPIMGKTAQCSVFSR